MIWMGLGLRHVKLLILKICLLIELVLWWDRKSSQVRLSLALYFSLLIMLSRFRNLLIRFCLY